MSFWCQNLDTVSLFSLIIQLYQSLSHGSWGLSCVLIVIVLRSFLMHFYFLQWDNSNVYVCVFHRATVVSMVFLVCLVIKDTGYVQQSQKQRLFFSYNLYYRWRIIYLQLLHPYILLGWLWTTGTTRGPRRGRRAGTQICEYYNINITSRYCVTADQHLFIHNVLLLLCLQGDDGDVGPRGLPGEPVSVSVTAQLILHLPLFSIYILLMLLLSVF